MQPVTVVSPVHLLRIALASWDAEKVEGAYGESPCPSPLLPLPLFSLGPTRLTSHRLHQAVLY